MGEDESGGQGGAALLDMAVWRQATRRLNWRSDLRGDLECIVLKALEKEPQRRYQSAVDLRQDLLRFLDRRPISARPPSTVYMLRKFAVRHKAISALALALLLTLVASAVVFVLQAAEIRRERDAAEVAAGRSEQANRFLTSMLMELNPTNLGVQVPMRELLHRTAARIDTELAGIPTAQAAVHDAIGRAYLSLRETDDAEPHLDAALRLRREALGERSPSYAASLHQMARLRSQRQDVQAVELAKAAYQLRVELLGESHPDVAESLEFLALYTAHTGDYDEGLVLLRRALDIRRTALGSHPSVAGTQQTIAMLLVQAGRYDEAAPLLEETLALQRATLGDDHFDVAMTLRDLGEIALQRGDTVGAEAHYRQQVSVLRKVFGVHGSLELAHAMSDLAGTLVLRDERDEAERLYLDSIEMERRTAPGGRCALTRNNYAMFLRDEGRFDEALEFARLVYDEWYLPENAWHPGCAYAAQNLGSVLMELAQLDDAERYFEQAMAVWRKLFANDHPKLASALTGLAKIKWIRGDMEGATRLFEQAHLIRRDRLGNDHAESWLAQLHVARAYAGQNRCEEAEAIGQDAIEQLERISVGRSQLVEPGVLWGEIMLACQLFQAAHDAFTNALAIEDSLVRESHPLRARALLGMAEAELAIDRPEMARASALQALDICRTRFRQDDHRLEKAIMLIEKSSSAELPWSE